MTRIDSTQVRWRVQVRKSRAHKWVNKGLYETRAVARHHAAWFRHFAFDIPDSHGYGFGNTRTVRHISGKGRAC